MQPDPVVFFTEFSALLDVKQKSFAIPVYSFPVFACLYSEKL
jgi:hypothetical protein